MKNIIKKESLRTAICLMLVLVMAVTILPENVQAVTVKSGFTMDLVDLKRSGDIKCFGKVGKGGAKFLNTVVEAPEGATVYIEEDFHICSGKYVYQVYYEGRNWAVEAKRIEGLAETARGTAHATYTKRSKKNGIKVKKTALVGDVMDPLHYYFIYAKPKATDKNCIGFVAVGAGIQVINENYNSEWAEILWGNYSVGYIKKDCLNYADGDLAGLELRRQQDVKQAKKAKLTYKGILKDYDKDLKKKEFCRLAVNWYKATGHTLPKQSKKSPYTDTKDPYVIMAHQLGIVKSTSNKKFRPDKMLTNNQYNQLVKRLLKITKNSKVYDYMKTYSSDSTDEGCGVSRETALCNFYRSYRMLQKKNYLVGGDDWRYSEVTYTISPADNPMVCLDVFEAKNDVGAEIGLYSKKGSKNQKFLIYYVNGFTTINSLSSQKTMSGSRDKVYQDRIWYEREKMTIEYNDDGTVCIQNGEGLYLDIKGGKAVSNAHLCFAPKSDSSTQKFVFTLIESET
ncbi:MAG: S-layer homology domain-containing protein [Lachnobacterium sp.]|nr:S-layer homology domain-containing protein [Lachnobacterium sp.]